MGKREEGESGRRRGGDGEGNSKEGEVRVGRRELF